MTYLKPFETATSDNGHQQVVDAVRKFLHQQMQSSRIDGVEEEDNFKNNRNITVFKIMGTHSEVRYNNYTLMASGDRAKALRKRGEIRGRSI